MIDVICGLMGSGKSTYARTHYKYVVEHEYFRSKEEQIARALKLHKQGKRVAYVTCYPLSKETAFFETLDPSEINWYLIDTDIMQANKNIIKRGRKSDADVIQARFKKNRIISERLAKCDIKFQEISVFESGEQW